MAILINLLLGTMLLAIAWEDFRSRTVRIYWFLGLFAALLYLQIIGGSVAFTIEKYAINLLFILFILVVLHVYYAVKMGRWIWIMDKRMGWGDIVFLICIAGVWSLAGFVAFMVLSLLFSLIIFIALVKRHASTVPLAGLQSICFGIFYILEKNTTLSLDNWIRL